MNNIKNQTNRNGGLLRPALLCLLTLAIAAAALIIGGMSLSKSRAESATFEEHIKLGFDYNQKEIVVDLGNLDYQTTLCVLILEGDHSAATSVNAFLDLAESSFNGSNGGMMNTRVGDNKVFRFNVSALKSHSGQPIAFDLAKTYTIVAYTGLPVSSLGSSHASSNFFVYRTNSGSPFIANIKLIGNTLTYTPHAFTDFRDVPQYIYALNGGANLTAREITAKVDNKEGRGSQIVLSNSGRTDLSAELMDYLFPDNGLYGCAFYSVALDPVLDRYSTTFTYSKGGLPLPVPPEREGYDFVGWFYDAAFTRPYDGAPIYEDTQLYAKYSAKVYTVTVDLAGGTWDSSFTSYNVSHGNQIVPILAGNTIARIGYVFSGWKVDGVAVDASYLVTKPITIVAQWSRVTYVLTLDSQGGTVYSPVTVDYGMTYKDANLPVPSKDGYNFLGWQKNGQTVNQDEVIAVNETLTAAWELKTYTVNVDPAGGSIVDSLGDPVTEVVVSHGVAVVGVLNGYTLTREGYNFLGWYVGETKYESNSPVTSNCIIVARWEIKTYTVTFIIDGEVFKTLEVQHGTTFQTAMNANPALAYMNLLNESGEKISKSSEVTSAVTVPIGEMTTEEKIAAFIGNNWWVLWALGGIALASIAAAVIASVVAHKRR